MIRTFHTKRDGAEKFNRNDDELFRIVLATQELKK